LSFLFFCGLFFSGSFRGNLFFYGICFSFGSGSISICLSFCSCSICLRFSFRSRSIGIGFRLIWTDY